MTARGDDRGAGVLILGAEGRIGRTLGDMMPRARLAARSPSRAEVRRVEDYARPPRDLFDGIDVAINCAGIVRGDDGDLMRVNATMPAALAQAARSAGVRRFVHVSSLSVYGHARRIHARTAEAPLTAYGRSKAAGDVALQGLGADGFDVAMLRLPAIVGPGTGGKTARLLRLWARTGVMVVPRGDVQRSMIGLDLTAQCLAVLARAREAGVVLAADPTPFSYGVAARAMSAATGRRFATIAISRGAVALLSRAVPAMAASLWADSLLDQNDNLAIREGMRSTLEANLSAMIAPIGHTDR